MRHRRGLEFTRGDHDRLLTDWTAEEPDCHVCEDSKSGEVGFLLCPDCDGSGQEAAPDGATDPDDVPECCRCSGSGQVRCPNCNA